MFWLLVGLEGTLRRTTVAETASGAEAAYLAAQLVAEIEGTTRELLQMDVDAVSLKPAAHALVEARLNSLPTFEG